MEWYEIKEKFEKEVLCPALRGRVRFEYTDYVHEEIDIETLFSDEEVSMKDNCLSIYADDQLLYKFDTKDFTERFARMTGELRHSIQDILSKSYMSWENAFAASWDITDEYIPQLTSKEGIMRAEHAVRNMKEFINSTNPDDQRLRNDFIFVLWLLSKYSSAEYVLKNYDGRKQVYADKWYSPFVELRLEAERVMASGRNT